MGTAELWGQSIPPLQNYAIEQKPQRMEIGPVYSLFNPWSADFLNGLFQFLNMVSLYEILG